MVIAGDNVLDFSLTKFIEYFKEKNASVVMRYYEADKARLCKKADVYAFEMPGKRYDIGNVESYTKIKNEYKGIRS